MEEKAEKLSNVQYPDLPRVDAGLWLVIDTLVGLIGWAVFGTAWNEVRVGCRRVFQFSILLGVCLAAHYIWAVCYPVVSIVIALIMTLAWCLRKILRVVGTIFYYLQRWTGGAPETSGLDFIGPGTGKIPETTELRQLKRTGEAEKWIAVRRGAESAVFAIGNESQSIESHGLYIPVEPDTVRGHGNLVQLIRTVDKVHLCRNEACPEDCTAHFQLYAVVKQFNPEKFQLAQAEEGARETGRRLWSWLRGTTNSAQRLAKKVTEYTSESEAELPRACEAHRVGWTTDQGLERLSEAVCKVAAEPCRSLLAEDVPKGCSELSLCPVHQARYMSTRLPSKCVVHGCNRLGFLSSAGMHLCTDTRRPRGRPWQQRGDPGPGRGREQESRSPKKCTMMKKMTTKIMGRHRRRSCYKRRRRRARGAGKGSRPDHQGTPQNPASTAIWLGLGCWIHQDRVKEPACWKSFVIDSPKENPWALQRRTWGRSFESRGCCRLRSFYRGWFKRQRLSRPVDNGGWASSLRSGRGVWPQNEPRSFRLKVGACPAKVAEKPRQSRAQRPFQSFPQAWRKP